MTVAGPKPIRVFLVAEHAALRQNIGMLLAGEGIVVCGWTDEAGAALRKIPPKADLVLIGLSGGEPGGLTLLREMSACPGLPPGLVLSAHDDACAIGLAFAAGARGYVPNRQASEVLAHAIREVVAGRDYIPRSLGLQEPRNP